MKTIQELLDILILKNIGNNNFNGISKTVGSPNVYGGQVLAQALNAAYRTVPTGRFLHSLHSYFLESGNLELPITYKVNSLRDGGSFSTRRVTAIQENIPIFILGCSFHKKEDGYDFQNKMKKNIKQPEELFSWSDMSEQMGDFMPKKIKTFLNIERPVDFKPVQIANPFEKKDLPPFLDVWFKPKGEINGLSIPLKQQVLTYISDYNLLTTCLNPHASKAEIGNTQLASLDHSMWFYRDFDFTDWLLFSIESVNTFGARGLAKGNIFTRNGELIATVTQEGLMRPRKEKH